jgi:hypothetical protein
MSFYCCDTSRTVHLLYDMLSAEAEPFVSWPGSSSEKPLPYADASAALAYMLTKQEWHKARRYTPSRPQAHKCACLSCLKDSRPQLCHVQNDSKELKDISYSAGTSDALTAWRCSGGRELQGSRCSR